MNVLVQRLVSTPVVLSERDSKVPTFEQIYATWFHEVARWVRAFGGLEADVEDLTQEVFMVVRRKLNTFDGRNLAGWLYRVAQRTVRDYRRRAWFRRIFAGKPAEPDAESPSSWMRPPDPGEIFEQREAEKTLGQILSQMSAVRRSAFILFEVEGYSGEEIAKLEGIPLNTVWTRLHHARKDFVQLVHKARAEGRIS
jgi:RNA polymerase sigma-70 factor (ECF subfamily)